MYYEVQENSRLTLVGGPGRVFPEPVLYSCDGERFVWRRLAAPLQSYALTFLRWIFAPANSTKRDAKSSCKSCRFKLWRCSWTARGTSSGGKNCQQNCGRR